MTEKLVLYIFYFVVTEDALRNMEWLFKLAVKDLIAMKGTLKRGFGPGIFQVDTDAFQRKQSKP
jgi:hypothetical protein